MTANEKAEKALTRALQHKQGPGSSEKDLRDLEGTAQLANLGQEHNSSSGNSGVPPLALQVWR